MRLSVLGLAATGSIVAANAQVTDTGATSSASGPVLEEIIVAARRRDENLQDTPVSVSVFGADELTRRAATKIESVADFTPNLRRAAGPQGGSSGHYFARGVGQLDFIASTDPGVGVYLDGVYLGRTTGAAFDLLDVDRIEVLRGPQGTLFGRNSIGGAINVVSAAPPTENGGGFSVILAERQQHEARFDFGGTLGDDALRGEIALLNKSGDGWQRRISDGFRFGDERTSALRGALEWQASSALVLQATVDATRGRGTADPHYLVAANVARGGRPEYVVTDPSTTWVGQESPDDLDVRGTSFTVVYDLPRFTLKSIAAYRELDSSTGIDFDGSPFPDLDQSVLTAQTQASEELQFSGTGLKGRLEWLTGAFFFSEDVEQGAPTVFLGQTISQNNALDNRSTALFAHATYSLSERLSVSGGLRSSVETKRHTFDHYIADNAGNVPLFPITTLKDRWRSLTPKLGVEVHLRDDLLFYASLSQGFRSGGFNGRPFGSDEFQSYDPETLTTLETGIKSEWLERRVRLNAAAFSSRYDDIQLVRADTSSSGTPIVLTGNAGEAEVYGLEAELTAAVTERLLLTAALGNIHNRYTRLKPGTTVTLDDKLPVSPPWTANASAEYTAQLARGTLRAGVGFNYTGRFNYFFENTPISWQEPYRLWNARVSFAPRDPLELAVFVRNLADERYSVFREDVLATFGIALVWPAEPRVWGFETRYRF